MRIGLGVMAHPTRARAVERLVDKLENVYAVQYDLGGGENETGDRAWASLAEMATDWSVILQDDALPVDDFHHHLERALWQAGRSVVGLYVGTNRPRDHEVTYATQLADTHDASWLTCDMLLWGVGVAIPTPAVSEFLSWTETHMIGTDDLYDHRIGMWARRAGLQVKYPWPSLVDHADGYSLAAEANGMVQPRGVRVARRLGTRDSYDGPSVRIPRKGEPLPAAHLAQSP